MSLVSNLKNIFALTTVLFLFTACGGGGGSASSTTATTVSNSPSTIETTTPTAKAVHSGQVKDSSTGDGLGNVTVSLGESTTTTDENGFYALTDLTANEEVFINFEKEGYLLGSTQIKLKSLDGEDAISSNYLEYNMHAHDYQWDYESTGEISGGGIIMNASYLDKDAKPYSGTITAELTILNPTEVAMLTTFPGTYKGINSNGIMVQFSSYGLTSITLKDSKGNRLHFADGETGTLIFNNVSSLEKPETLPLWYYDYDQGLWVEEGYAELQEDGTYKGDISHLGTWSLNKPLEDEAGIYRGRIINEDGSPMSDVRVHAVGENWIGSDLSTDEDGMFEIKVIPGSSFQLKAYDYKNKYSAAYNATIAAIASGDVIE